MADEQLIRAIQDLTTAVAQVQQTQDQIAMNQAHMHHENVQRGKHVEETVDETADRVRALQDIAFPGGDADGHRRYHESVIAEKEARRMFFNDMRTSLARWGLLGVAAFVGMAIWTYFQARVMTR